LCCARIVPLELLNRLFNFRWDFHHEHDILPDKPEETGCEPNKESAGEREDITVECFVKPIKKIHFSSHCIYQCLRIHNKYIGIPILLRTRDPPIHRSWYIYPTLRVDIRSPTPAMN
jgi:hypothetical protein